MRSVFFHKRCWKFDLFTLRIESSFSHVQPFPIISEVGNLHPQLLTSGAAVRQ